jgi:hypothetical protein
MRFASGLEAQDTDQGIELIDRAIGSDPWMILGDACAIAQAGLTLVAGACVNAGEINH